MKSRCFACFETEGLVLSTCCHRPCCSSHRYGDGSIASGFTCSDHPFGMAYESTSDLPSSIDSHLNDLGRIFRRILYLTVLAIALGAVAGMLLLKGR